MITLSVVVPVRDGEAYLGDALTSLVRNRTPEFETEVVVVDDGSADATPEVVEDFRRDLPGLAVVRNPVPLGPAGATASCRSTTRRWSTTPTPGRGSTGGSWTTR